jgi:uncharacterized protein (DUF983 family)
MARDYRYVRSHPSPKCGLGSLFTRDVGGDLVCLYCGWVDYGKSPDRGAPTTKPPKCGGVVL